MFSPFHTVCGVLKTRILKWFAIPFSSGPHFVRTLFHDPSILGGPTQHGSQVHWVRQGCDPTDKFGLFVLSHSACLTLCDHVDYSPPGSSVHENSPDKNTRMGCQALLQGIFPTQGLNPGLLHCRQFLYYLSYEESPTILEWVAFFFSRGSSYLKNQTEISFIASEFLTSWLVFCKCWIPPKKDTPHSRAKEKPQQDGRRGEIAFRIKPYTH